MAKRRMGIMLLLLCFCVSLMPWHTQAASTSDAKEPISTGRDCSLTISYSCDGNACSGETVKLYKIADVSASFQYTPKKSFATLILNGIQTNEEWNEIRTTAEALILAGGVEPAGTAVTDASGLAGFESLKPGLYLASAVRTEQYAFASALVAVPGLGTDGFWQYQVAVAAKPQILPPSEPGDEIQLKVLKLWKGKGDRPQSIQVEIFRDGICYETVELSGENHWFYTWTVENDGADWCVIERNIPAGYTMTVQQRENTFIVINTWAPDIPDDPEDPTTPSGPDDPDDPTTPSDPDDPDDPTAPSDPDDPEDPTTPSDPDDPDDPTTPSDPDDPDAPPQTGDTANILLYTVLMYISGGLLILLGIAGKRKRHEKTN